LKTFKKLDMLLPLLQPLRHSLTSMYESKMSCNMFYRCNYYTRYNFGHLLVVTTLPADRPSCIWGYYIKVVTNWPRV